MGLYNYTALTEQRCCNKREEWIHDEKMEKKTELTEESNLEDPHILNKEVTYEEKRKARISYGITSTGRTEMLTKPLNDNNSG